MKRFLLFGFLLCTNSVFSQVIPTGLVAYYPFSGNAIDSSGNGHNGTVNGATLTTDRLGAPNKAYLFDGTNDFISVPNFNTILTSDEVSISFWAISTLFTSQSPFLLLPDNFNDRFNIHINYNHNGSPATMWDYGNPVSGGRISKIPDPYVQQWNHYVFISSASQNFMAIYRNGALVTTSQVHSPLVNKSKTLNIGGGIGSGGTSLFFHGSIDDIAIYNRVLTTNEIQILFSGCTGAPVATVASYGNTTICKGDDVLLICQAFGVNYQWQKSNVNIAGANGFTYKPKNAGNYRCVVTNSCGTSSSNTIHVTTLPLTTVTVSATTPTTICAGGSVSITGTNPGAGYTYQWFKGNISLNGQTGLNLTAYSPGNYKLVNTNTANGCSGSSNAIAVAVTCRMSNPGELSGSVEPSKDNEMIVFPNPSKGSFTVQLNTDESLEGNGELELFNMAGQRIYHSTENIESGNFEKEIIFDHNEVSGLYTLILRLNDKTFRSKVMIN